MSRFVKVAAAAQIAPGSALKVRIEDREIAVFNLDGEFLATADQCTHMNASLSEGRVTSAHVICPWHGARFEVRTGRCLGAKPHPSLQTYNVRLEGDDVEVELPDP